MVNFVRNIGGSVGIALISTYITRTRSCGRTYLAANMRDRNPKFQQMIDGMAATLRNQGVGAGHALQQAYGRAEIMVQQQAAMLAFKDVVSAPGDPGSLLIPLTFIMKKPPAHGAPPPMH